MMLNIINIEDYMTFNEKSAWVMVLALLIGTGILAFLINGTMEYHSQIPAEASRMIVLGPFVVFIIALIFMSIFGHIVIALFAPKDANSSDDERDKLVKLQASKYSGIVLGVMLNLLLVSYFIWDFNGLLFYGILVSLIASQLTEYILQLIFYKRAL